MEETALTTLKSMLISRGLKDVNFEEVKDSMNETRMYAYDKILIIFSQKARITQQEFYNFIEFAKENKYTSDIIVISLAIPSDSLKDTVRNYVSIKENQLVQLFYIGHLQFKYAEHELVPKHRILTSAEITELMKEYHIKALQNIPKIDSQDAMVRWIGARPGDVIEITGMDVSSAEGLRYRYCIPNVF